jgi:hypothetical protein
MVLPFPNKFIKKRHLYASLFNYIVNYAPRCKKRTYKILFADDDERGDYYEWYIGLDVNATCAYALGVILNAIIKKVDYLEFIFGDVDIINIADCENAIEYLSTYVEESVDEGYDVSEFPDWDDATDKFKVRNIDYIKGDKTTDEDENSNTFTLETIARIIGVTMSSSSSSSTCLINPSEKIAFIDTISEEPSHKHYVIRDIQRHAHHGAIYATKGFPLIFVIDVDSNVCVEYNVQRDRWITCGNIVDVITTIFKDSRYMEWKYYDVDIFIHPNSVVIQPAYIKGVASSSKNKYSNH